MELVELNEAFAAQSLGVIHELEEATGMDRERLLEKTNVNGGAIALGHPVGASGNRILVTLIHEMQKRNLTTGLASLCIRWRSRSSCYYQNVQINLYQKKVQRKISLYCFLCQIFSNKTN